MPQAFAGADSSPDSDQTHHDLVGRVVELSDGDVVASFYGSLLKSVPGAAGEPATLRTGAAQSAQSRQHLSRDEPPAPSLAQPPAAGWPPGLDPRAALCECGGHLVLCEGCRESRCLQCDPYRSDDCRWSL